MSEWALGHLIIEEEKDTEKVLYVSHLGMVSNIFAHELEMVKFEFPHS
jgi:hypothetical protein